MNCPAGNPFSAVLLHEMNICQVGGHVCYKEQQHFGRDVVAQPFM